MRERVALIAVLLVAAGCRSDGGFGREDCARGLAFSTGRVASRTRGDVARTLYTVRNVPERVAASVSEGTRSIRSTYLLYVDNHAVR